MVLVMAKMAITKSSGRVLLVGQKEKVILDQSSGLSTLLMEPNGNYADGPAGKPAIPRRSAEARKIKAATGHNPRRGNRWPAATLVWA